MEQRWSLCVENFGRIEKAEIEVSPLMMFVGDNNSGKSYVMSLLWGLVKEGYDLLRRGADAELQSYKRCEQWFDSLEDKNKIVLDKEAKETLIDWVNCVLEMEKDALVKEVFNKAVSIGKLSIKLIGKETSKINMNHVTDCVGTYIDDIDRLIEGDRVTQKAVALTQLCCYLIFHSATTMEDLLFLPASRTGFMLTYKTLLGRSIKSSFGAGKVELDKFTSPVIDFLHKLVELDAYVGGKYLDVARFIENELIKGTILKDESPIINIYYKPEHLEENLPLYLTSSLITEVAPLILFLSNGRIYDTIIIEEPEAHLHLKAQIVMARAIARLINMGANLWLTTHSDTFFQQINNLIKLNEHPKKHKLLEQFGFSEEECLDYKKITVYEFNIKGDKTEVTKLEGSPTGFPIPTFNEVINNLVDEILTLEEGEND